MTHTVTLIGYLGKDPETRETQERTLTRQVRREPHIFELNGVRTTDRAEDIAEEPAVYDVNLPSREYIVLSLATHEWKGRERITTWHRVIVWNVDPWKNRDIRICRKGSKVEVTGHKTSFTTREGETLEQIELTAFRILQLK